MQNISDLKLSGISFRSEKTEREEQRSSDEETVKYIKSNHVQLRLLNIYTYHVCMCVPHEGLDSEKQKCSRKIVHH